MWETGHRLQKISKGSGGTGLTGPGSLLFPSVQSPWGWDYIVLSGFCLGSKSYF